MNDDFGEEAVCFFCGSRNLFRDSESDDLICNDCGTQSQNFSQRESAEAENSIATTATRTIRTSRSSNDLAVDEHAIDDTFRVPTLLEFSEAFLSLVELAARRSVDDDLMLPLDRIEGFSNYKERILQDSREIFLLYLERFDESANYFMSKFPGIRISLKDKFLSHNLLTTMLLQMNQSIQVKVNKKLNTEERNTNRKSSEVDTDSDDEGLYDDFDEAEGSSCKVEYVQPSQTSNTRSPKLVRWKDSQNTLIFDSQESSINSPMNIRAGTKSDIFEPQRNLNMEAWEALKSSSISKLSWKDFKDDSLYWKLEILELMPDLNLVTTIVYLAHLCSHTGVASNHFVMWAKMGKYPYLLDAYGNLGEKHRELLKNLVSKWRQDRVDLVSPEELEDSASVLLHCLVDPKDKKEYFLSELFRLNADRMVQRKFLLGNYTMSKVRDLGKHKHRKIEMEDGKQLDSDCSQQSSNASFQLGQYSQESEDTNVIYEDIPKSYHNVGMMCNMFCAALGVENRVLNFSYALMGMPVNITTSDYDADSNGKISNDMRKEKEEPWLPAALELAHPSMLITPSYVIAVIVVACKFCPDWESWRIFLSKDEIFSTAAASSPSLSHQCNTDNDASSSNDDEIFMSRRKKRKHSGSMKQVSESGMPPIYDSNGENPFVKLDAIPTTERKAKKTTNDFKKERTIFTTEDFKTSLSVLSNVPLPHRKRKNQVFGNAVLSDKLGYVRASSTRLASKNGLSVYLAYNRKSIKTSSGVHEPYFKLLSYIADTLCVDRKELHFLVMRFDEEIIYNAKWRQEK